MSNKSSLSIILQKQIFRTISSEVTRKQPTLFQNAHILGRVYLKILSFVNQVDLKCTGQRKHPPYDVKMLECTKKDVKRR